MKTILVELMVLGGIVAMLDIAFLYSTSSIVLPVYQNIQQMPLKFRYYSIFLCYAFIILGLYYFIIREKRTWQYAFLLGLFVYGVYDLTVLSVFSKYKPEIAIMDMLWGGILFSSSTYIYRRIM
jgi:uncharacterized membrane protein